jgi:large subunit ribosomal protein L32e
MTTEIKRLIQVRIAKGATFKRDGFGKKRQLSDSWRKPRGQHNKQREQKKAKGALPKPGFGSPVAVRGMHPSGFFEVLVSTLKELEGLDPKTQVVRIGATVGGRKRVTLQEKALASGLKVLNARTVGTKAKKEPVKKAAKDEGKHKKDEKKPVKSKAPAAPKKTDTKKAKKTDETEEKKTPEKATKKAAKPKTEKPEKSSEKAPEKTAKKSAPTKTKKAKESAEAKPKSAPKPKTIKKPATGVKKDE